MDKRFLAPIYVAPVAAISVYGRPMIGDLWAFTVVIIYMSLPFLAWIYFKKGSSEKSKLTPKRLKKRPHR